MIERILSQQSPEAFASLSEPARYKVFYGGRGSGKSWAFAAHLIERGVKQKTRILCTREYQNSIEDSVYKLLSDTIDRHELNLFYHKTRAAIIGANGTEFLFEGLHNNTNSIRSLEGIDICWVCEAQPVAEESWQILLPTIRKDNSEIWIDFNPESTDDPVYKRFVINPPDNAISKKVIWRDNPWFPPVSRAEMEHDKAIDYDLYMHVWEGEPRKISASQIFHGKWFVEDFSSAGVEEFYCGADWGFANDPTAVVRCFIKDNNLYIDRESGGTGIEIDETPAFLDAVLPHKHWPTRGDSSRPETISYLNRQEYNIIPSEKGPGSVEDGIAFIRSFDKIMVHPRCKNVLEEFRLYSYKQDRRTGDVLPVPIDAHNHWIDSIRYALEPIMKAQGKWALL